MTKPTIKKLQREWNREMVKLLETLPLRPDPTGFYDSILDTKYGPLGLRLSGAWLFTRVEHLENVPPVVRLMLKIGRTGKWNHFYYPADGRLIDPGPLAQAEYVIDAIKDFFLATNGEPFYPAWPVADASYGTNQLVEQGATLCVKLFKPSSPAHGRK
jgi:hypothetical protein